MKSYYNTTCDLARLLFEESVPLTSVRRAMTNLEHEGSIEKTLNMKLGRYGKKVHLWTFKARVTEK